MKLVRFDNGKYGIRLSWHFGWKFLDLDNGNACSNPKQVALYCQGEEEIVRKRYKNYLDTRKYKIVKD